LARKKTTGKTTARYRFYDDGGDELHCGITDNKTRRQREHRHGFGEPEGVLRQVGPLTSRKKASEWEKRVGCSPYNREPVVTPRPRMRQAPTLSGAQTVAAVGKGVVAGVAIAGGIIGLAALLDALFNKPTPTPQNS